MPSVEVAPPETTAGQPELGLLGLLSSGLGIPLAGFLGNFPRGAGACRGAGRREGPDGAGGGECVWRGPVGVSNAEELLGQTDLGLPLCNV